MPGADPRRGQRETPPPDAADIAAARARIDGLADAYYRAAEGRTLPETGRLRRDARETFKDLPDDATEAEVAGCTAYLLADPWHQQPGVLSPAALVKAFAGWRRSGKPERAKPRASGKPVSYNLSDGEHVVLD